MEHVLVETLVNVRQYQCMLHFELPLDVPVASHPEMHARVQGIRTWLKPEGLFLHGTVLEEVSYLREHGEREQKEQMLHFTYLVPVSDLQEPNLLNLQIEPTVEQMHYHCIRKDRQVIIQQDLLLQLVLSEYSVLESASSLSTGLQKKSGIFLKRVGEVEESFLKMYPVQRPDDFSLLIKLSGQVNELKVERTEDGCILDWICHIQGEYVTDAGKVGTFFFEKREYVFFPLPSALTTEAGQIRAQVTIPDLTLESAEELMVLYRCHLQLVEPCEIHFYTGNPVTLPEGAVLKRVEVEQVSQQQMIASQMIEERIDLVTLAVASITQVSGECKHVQVEEVQDQLLISGDLEFAVTYLDQDRLERTYLWKKQFDQIIPCMEPRGGWRMDAQVQVPDWAIRDGTLSLTAVVDYQGQYHIRSQEWVLAEAPAEWQHTQQERFLVREEIDAGYITLSGEENVYLHRYATRILQIQGQITAWQVRAVDGGWMAKGQAELVIYYETGEGERHISQPFRWYQFIPSADTSIGTDFDLHPELRVLDTEMLEDGSVVRLRHLIRLLYTIYREREEEIVTKMDFCTGRMRPVLSTGRIERQFTERISLEDGLLAMNRVREIQSVQIGWRDYHVHLHEDALELVGEVEVQTRYRNRMGRERVQVNLLLLRLLQPLAVEGEPCQQVRAVPLIKGYDYRLTAHPPKESTLDLSIFVELCYRLVGQISCL